VRLALTNEIMTEEFEAKIKKLERENRILQKKLARSEENRASMEDSRDRYDTLYQSVIRQLDEHQALLSEKNQMLEILSGKLSKYLSPQVYSSIFIGAQTVEIASKRKKLTVCFSDIVGFTETTKNLEAEELSSILNRYLTEMSKIALEYGATIDKYIGDAMVLFFGDPETKGTKEDAKACVKMAIAMQRRMQELEQESRDRGLERPFKVRIGISTGFCTVGNFGSEDRMDYTIIGNEVNLAARLEASAESGDSRAMRGGIRGNPPQGRPFLRRNRLRTSGIARRNQRCLARHRTDRLHNGRRVVVVSGLPRRLDFAPAICIRHHQLRLGSRAGAERGCSGGLYAGGRTSESEIRARTAPVHHDSRRSRGQRPKDG